MRKRLRTLTLCSELPHPNDDQLDWLLDQERGWNVTFSLSCSLVRKSRLPVGPMPTLLQPVQGGAEADE